MKGGRGVWRGGQGYFSVGWGYGGVEWGVLRSERGCIETGRYGRVCGRLSISGWGRGGVGLGGCQTSAPPSMNSGSVTRRPTPSLSGSDWKKEAVEMWRPTPAPPVGDGFFKSVMARESTGGRILKVVAREATAACFFSKWESRRRALVWNVVGGSAAGTGLECLTANGVGGGGWGGRLREHRRPPKGGRFARRNWAFVTNAPSLATPGARAHWSSRRVLSCVFVFLLCVLSACFAHLPRWLRGSPR